MSKLDRLNARVSKLLNEVVREVLEVVKETVSEYQEKTARTQRENRSLRRRLLELQDTITRERAPVVPGGGPLPEDKQDAQTHISVSQGRGSGATQPPSSPAPGHHVKQECGEHGSHDDPEAQAGHASRRVLQGAGTVRPSLSANRDFTSVSSLSRPPSICPLDVHPALTSEPRPDQYPGCVDLSCNSSRHHSEAPGPQGGAEPRGLTVGHSKPSTQRRRGLSKASRTLFDMRRIKAENSGDDDTHLCVVCGKTFSRVGNLRIHQRCHTGERPYGCTQCGRRFSQAGDLKKHKRVHTGEKPYYCTQCGKSFSRGENLKRHEKIHIGERLQQS